MSELIAPPMIGPVSSEMAYTMLMLAVYCASFAGGVNDQYKNLKEPQGVGHWFLVFKPDSFLDDSDELKSRMDELMTRTRGCEKAHGVERIYTARTGVAT